MPAPTIEIADPIGVGRPQGDAPRMLILGWSGKAPNLLAELARHLPGQVEVDVVTSRPASEREADLASSGVDLGNLRLRHLVGDVRTILDSQLVDMTTYDRVVTLASDTAPDVESADARTIAGHLVIRHLLAGSAHPVHVVVELLDPANVALLEGSGSEVVVTPVLMADVLAGVVTHPDLEIILPALWTGRYGLPMTFELVDLLPEGTSYTLQELELLLRHYDLLPLALREGGSDDPIELLPDKLARREVKAHDAVAVLCVGSGSRGRPA